jgi:type VI secretion system secreted protein Hcp
MAVDMYLKLDPIKGESQNKDHQDQIEVLSWSWGMSQAGSMHTGTGGGAGKVSVQDLTFTHWVDKATTDLIKYCATGKHIQSGTLVVRKAGGDQPVEYITIDLDDIIITNVHTGGSQGEERLTENVTLNFRKFKYNYAQQTGTGTAGTKSKWGLDISANKEWS